MGRQSRDGKSKGKQYEAPAPAFGKGQYMPDGPQYMPQYMPYGPSGLGFQPRLTKGKGAWDSGWAWAPPSGKSKGKDAWADLADAFRYAVTTDRFLPPSSKNKGKGLGMHQGQAFGHAGATGRSPPSSTSKGRDVGVYPGTEATSQQGTQMAEREAFFDSLPPDEFTETEVALLDAMLEKLRSLDGSARLNIVVVDPNVKKFKLALLPKKVGIAHWIERRAGIMLAVQPDPLAPDNQIVSIVENDKRETRMSDRETFFESLPLELSAEEETLLTAMQEKLVSVGGSARLNSVVMDPNVRQAKRALLGKNVGIACWVERRVSTYFTVQDDPVAKNNQIVSLADSVVDEPLAKRRKV